MRLLDTLTGQFVEKDPRDPKTKYAILSHTWDGQGEQTYEELKRIQKRNAFHARPLRSIPHCDSPSDPPLFTEQHQTASALTSSTRCAQNMTISTSNLSPVQDGHLSGTPTLSLSSSFPESQHSPDLFSAALAFPVDAPSELDPFWVDPDLSPKIREACKVARERGYLYIWIDSCCIDKSSSSELSEAINSMYYWYSRAEVCYAFLADVPAKEDPGPKNSLFRQSRWFTRGWTLQELIAPVHVVFFSQGWTFIGSKSTLARVVTDITNIDRHALLHVKGLETFSVAQRFSWAARRQTTRLEDRAYSLLGLFDLNMPTLYGEGDRAFQRLQEEILRRIPDQSLFAWTSLPFDPVGMTHFVRRNHAAQMSQYGFSECSPGDPVTRRPLSLLAPSPEAFAHCGSIKVVNHDEVLRRMELQPLISSSVYSLRLPDGGFHYYGTEAHAPIIPHTVTTHDCVISPHGVQIQVLMISLSHYLPHKDGPSSQNDLSRWYLVVLGCEHEDFPRRLLGRPCFVSGSTAVPVLRCGSVSIYSKLSGSCLVADLLPISQENIQHVYGSFGPTALVVRSVYLDYPDMADEAFKLDVARRQPHETITLMLSSSTLAALDTRGYKVQTGGPDQARPADHSFTFSNRAHTITIECHHILEDDSENQKLSVEARFNLSGTLLDDISREVHQVDGPTTLSWTDRIPWSSSLGEETVILHVARARTMSLQLSLTFVAKDHYSLEVVASVHSTVTSYPHPARRLPLQACKAVWKKLKNTPTRLQILARIVKRTEPKAGAGLMDE